MFRNLLRQLVPSLILTGIVAVVIGIAYPLALFGIGEAAFNSQVNGSLITRDGQVVGAVNIGQAFLDKDGNPLTQYFQPRPSATGPTPYNASASAASNLGPSDPRLVGFIPGFNTVGLDGAASTTNPFATPADPYCVPTDSSGAPVISPSAAWGITNWIRTRVS